MSLTITMDSMGSNPILNKDFFYRNWVVEGKNALMQNFLPGTTFPPVSHSVSRIQEKFTDDQYRPKSLEPDLTYLDLLSGENGLFPFDMSSESADVNDLDSDSSSEPDSLEFELGFQTEYVEYSLEAIKMCEETESILESDLISAIEAVDAENDTENCDSIREATIDQIKEETLPEHKICDIRENDDINMNIDKAELCRATVTEDKSENLQTVKSNEVEIKGDEKAIKLETLEVSSHLQVSAEKLNNLLRMFEEEDKINSPEDGEEPFDSKSYKQHSAPRTQHQTSVQERPKLRKCSSLKTNRHKSSSYGERKFVRFADILGLDLLEVKTFADEIPRIPRAAFEDLDVDMSDYEVGSPSLNSSFAVTAPPPIPGTTFVPMFSQPGTQPHFLHIVMEKKVCLENSSMDGSESLSGLVRVMNLSFHKEVVVRWTVDNWRTSEETLCSYVNGSSNGSTDQFSFKLRIGKLAVGSRIHLCIKYSMGEETVWDSNNGDNYTFQVFPSSSRNKQQSSFTSNPISIRSESSATNILKTTQSPKISTMQTFSPSQHGDDPWLRFF